MSQAQVIPLRRGLFIADIDPVAKPRQTKSDKWKKRPGVVRYRDFADRLREIAGEQAFDFPESGAEITFGIPMPSSWSRKKRAAMLGQPHQQKPDIDNLTKAVLDALLPDDSRVWNLKGQSKFWSNEGSIAITFDIK